MLVKYMHTENYDWTHQSYMRAIFKVTAHSRKFRTFIIDYSQNFYHNPLELFFFIDIFITLQNVINNCQNNKNFS